MVLDAAAARLALPASEWSAVVGDQQLETLQR
jgi:hypothetical protein